MRACVRACVRARARVCVCVCVCEDRIAFQLQRLPSGEWYLIFQCLFLCVQLTTGVNGTGTKYTWVVSEPLKIEPTFYPSSSIRVGNHRPTPFLFGWMCVVSVNLCSCCLDVCCLFVFVFILVGFVLSLWICVPVGWMCVVSVNLCSFWLDVCCLCEFVFLLVGCVLTVSVNLS